jgi:uncharacterized delta-60 repeat protein
MKRRLSFALPSLRASKLILLRLVVLALMVASIANAVMLAAVGDLDPSFGMGGRVISDFGHTDNQAFGMIVQPDGKIVVAGYGINSLTHGFDFLVARYNSSGSLDTGFGSGGKVYTDFFGSQELAYAVGIQLDGKIVAAGYIGDGLGGSDFAIARYNPDGSLDSSFGNGGKTTTSIGNRDEAYGLVIQPDGKIIIAGDTDVSRLPDFALVRYNSDGSLDPSFGSGGKVVTDWFGDTDIALAVALDSKGRVIAAGYTGQSIQTSTDFGVVRYNPNGSLDQNFGSHGKASTDFFGREDEGRDLAIQPDDKIVVTGYASLPPERRDFALVRYNTNGSLDSGFGAGGKLTTAITSRFDQSEAIAIQPNGKILVGGTASNADSPTGKDFALVRYNANGSLDQAFGSGGKVTTDFSKRLDEGQAIALQPDNKILLAGFSFNTSGGTGDDIILARYTNDGIDFDLCIQDDSSGNLLQINTMTGDYQFTNCAGLTLGSTGTLTKRGSLITLQHNSADRRVLATVDTSAKRATASVQLLSQGQMFSITDRNITNNTCACR